MLARKLFLMRRGRNSESSNLCHEAFETKKSDLSSFHNFQHRQPFNLRHIPLVELTPPIYFLYVVSVSSLEYFNNDFRKWIAFRTFQRAFNCLMRIFSWKFLRQSLIGMNFTRVRLTSHDKF